VAKNKKRGRSSNGAIYRNSGIIFAALGTWPFLETLLFHLHVDSGRPLLEIEEYLRFAAFSVVLWGAMCVCFLVEEADFQRLLSEFLAKLESFRRKTKHRSKLVLFAIPLILLAYFFGGRDAVVWLFEKGFITTLVFPAATLAVIAGLIWIIARLLMSLGDSLPTDFRSGVRSWGFSFKLAIPFYVLIIAGTWWVVDFSAINKTSQLHAKLGIAKDYLLLFIIVNLLYVGLFKLARAGSLRAVFQSFRGFLDFVLICGIIAVFAVWADFRTLDPTTQELAFSHEWQRDYNTIHLYVRDIGLLLMPIAGLLFWTLKTLSAESMHVAEIDFVEMYRPAFSTKAAAGDFVRRITELTPEKPTAKIVLHQAARMIWLSDRMGEVAAGRPALKILFWIICAEAVAKMVFGFEGEGQSKRFVLKFFEGICSDEHRAKLASAFSYLPSGGRLSCQQAIELLYKVRCDVVHEGMYYQFHLKRHPDSIPLLTSVGDETWVVHISEAEIRQIVLEGSVLGCLKLVDR